MRRKVLLADDSLSIQKMFGLYLERCNIDVVTMSNGELAISRLSSISPDLILADVFMPGRTGYEVCEYVKQHPDFKHIPVLLLTGKFEPYDEKEAKRVKADGHIVKPIAEQEFVSLIRTTLERFPPKPAVTPPPAVTQPVGQTQVLGSVPPPAASKEPSGLGAAPPKFHLGSLDPSAEVPPTIKVTPSMLASITSPPKMDDGRLPDLEPLLPLDAPPPSATPATDTTDFILDLPPPEQSPPVLTYPEPPKTLSTPIPRPTFSSLPPPGIGTTTAKLDPAELPELFTPAALPPPVVTPASPVVELDSPLELDDAVTPVAAPAAVPEPQGTTSAASSALDETAAPFAPLPAPIPDVLTTKAPPVEMAAVAVPEPTPSVTVPAEPPVAAALPAEPPAPSFEPVTTPEPVITPPTQVAQPWEQPAPAEPPITTAFQGQPETSSLPPSTSSLVPQPTGNLLTEPVPPPDFLTGLVSSPTTQEPVPAISTTLLTLIGVPVPPPPSEAVSPESPPPLTSFSTLPTAAAPPPAPVFEVVMEEEPPVRGTDLLPDELVAMRQPSPAVSEAIPVAAVSEVPSPTETEAGAVSPFTLEVPDRADKMPPTPPEADIPAAVVTTEAVATSLTEAPALEATAPPAIDEVAPEPSALPAFVPTPLESAPLEESGFSATPPAEAEAVEPGSTTPTDESVVAEEAALPAAPPDTLTDTMAPSPAVAAASLEAPEVLSTAVHSGEVQPEASVETAPATTPSATLVAEPAPVTPTAAQTVDWSTFTLPPAVMDEIVRRVVAEISDHVVREIAWEVVPDLAELLIKKHLANGNGRRNADG